MCKDKESVRATATGVLNLASTPASDEQVVIHMRQVSSCPACRHVLMRTRMHSRTGTHLQYHVRIQHKHTTNARAHIYMHITVPQYAYAYSINTCNSARAHTFTCTYIQYAYVRTYAYMAVLESVCRCCSMVQPPTMNSNCPFCSTQ